MISILDRSRLFDSLDSQALPKLLLITAPSGFGKTVLARQLVKWSQYEAIWQRLTVWQRDWTLLAEDSQALWSTSLSDVEQAKGQSPSEAGRALAKALSNAKASLYILDDIHHLLGSPNAELWLQNLIEDLPPHIHMVLVGQDLPLLTWSQFLARGWVWTLERNQLRFTREEIQALGHVPLSEAELLNEQMGGWIAGIRLALDSAKAQAQGISLTKGAEHLFADLALNFFETQSPDFQNFLLLSALPERFDAVICKEVLGLNKIEPHLKLLQRQHFFIDKEAGVYRYHELLRTFLLEHLQNKRAEQYRELHQKLGTWYEVQDQAEAAIWHYIQAGTGSSAANLADKISKEFQILGRWESLLRILGLLGDAASAQLSLTCAIILTEKNQLEDSAKLLQRAEQEFSRQGDFIGLTRCRLHLAFNYNKQGRYEEVLIQAKFVIEDATASPDLKAWAARVLAWAYLELGNIEGAVESIQTALPIYSEQENTHGRANILQDLGSVYLSSGDLETAAGYLQESLACHREVNNPQELAMMLNDVGFYYHCSSLYIDALDSFEEGLSYVIKNEGRAAAFLYWSQGDVLRDLGRFEEAEQAYLSALKFFGRDPNLNTASVLMSMAQLRYWQQRQQDVHLLLQEAERFLMGRLDNRKYMIDLMDQVLLSEENSLNSEAVFAIYERLLERKALIKFAQALGLSAWLMLSSEDQAVRERFLAYINRLPSALFQALAAQIYQLPSLRLLAEGNGLLGISSLRAALDSLEKQAVKPKHMAYPTELPLIKLEITALGQSQVRVNGELLQDSVWTVATAKELLFYLYFKSQATKEEIALDFWPEHNGHQIRNALRTTLKRLRAALPEPVVFDGLHYRLNPSYQLTDDCQKFRDYVHRASKLPKHSLRTEDLFQRAIKLYQGIFLPNVYKPWADVLRQVIERDYLQALLGMAHCLLLRDKAEGALKLYQKALEKEPYSEDLFCGLMICLSKLGQQTALQTAFDIFSKRLEEELNISPSQSTWDRFFECMSTLS